MPEAEVAVAVHARAEVGEGPVWESETDTLHWVDIPKGKIHASDVSTGETMTIDMPMSVGAVTPLAEGGYLAATAAGFTLVAPDGEPTELAHFLPASHRMNDAKCDPSGRYWAGSTARDYTSGAGALHVLDLDGSVRTPVEGMTLPNGLGWSPDTATFYLVDSFEQTLDAFDFDHATGSVARRRTLVTYTGNALPDGMCVDAEGCLWVALWDGKRVVRYSPEGEVITELAIPAQRPSSCTFGGADLNVLYVTSACVDLDLGDDSFDGSVFSVTNIGVAGLAATPWAGRSGG